MTAVDGLTSSPLPRVGFLHYTASPVVGGVEAVLDAHARLLAGAGYQVTILAGRGPADTAQVNEAGWPPQVVWQPLPELDTQHPQVLEISAALEQGRVPAGFAELRDHLVAVLRPLLAPLDVLVVHNVLSKHFNLPLTAALARLLEEGAIRRCLAWTHDITWTSPNSRSKVFDGQPWDLLRQALPNTRYVAISEQRQHELSELMGLPAASIPVVYNGVDPCLWYGLTPAGWALVEEMDLMAGDPILLMPVRVTQAKNIELAAHVLAALKEGGCRPRLLVTGPPDPHNSQNMAYYQGLLDLRARLGLERELRFVFESHAGAAAPAGAPAGSEPDSGHTIAQQVVADLLRISDVVFLPSHREGFGMPVLEAALLGIPVVSSEQVPAAREIGGRDVYRFAPGAPPAEIARLIHHEALDHPASRLRRYVRHHLTWERIFAEKIEPLLHDGG